MSNQFIEVGGIEFPYQRAAGGVCYSAEVVGSPRCWEVSKNPPEIIIHQYYFTPYANVITVHDRNGRRTTVNQNEFVQMYAKSEQAALKALIGTLTSSMELHLIKAKQAESMVGVVTAKLHACVQKELF